MKTEAFAEPGAVLLDGLNINISAYRVLYILLLLVQNRALSLTGLNQFLYDNPLIQRNYNNETITKYINTLRKAGCRIPRSSLRNDFHYELLKSPFLLSVEDADIALLERCLERVRERADGALLSGYQDFLGKVLWCLADEAQVGRLKAAVTSHQPLPDTRAEQERQALLQRYRAYCADALMLSLEYQEAGALVRLTVEPKRVAMEGPNLYLLGQDGRDQRRMKLDLQKIASVRQLPSKNRTGHSKTAVVFQLYGRLARNYRPYPGEELHRLGEDTLQVRVKTDDPQALMRRLLKYDRSCQVISPVDIRVEMRAHIARMLETLQCLNKE